MLISNFCEHSNQTVNFRHIQKFNKHTLPLLYILNYYKIMLRQKGVKKKKSNLEMNSYSKSVSSLSSARGWKTKDLFFMPNTQAVSGEFANIRPEGQKIYISNMKQGTLTYTFCLCNIFIAFIRPCPHRVCSILSVCQSAIKQTWSPFWWQSFGQMELVFHPNGIHFY